MPRWKSPTACDRRETWTWVDDDGYVLATVQREGDHWVVQSAAAGGIGEAGSRREATAMLTYDRLTKTAQASDAYKRRRAAAERAVAIRALGFKPEPEGAGYPEQYAGDTGELLSWAREKKSPAEIRAEVDQLLRETSPVKIMGRKKKSYASRH